MTALPRDNDRTTVIAGVLDSDGLTIKPIYANPSTHALKVANAATGSSQAGNSAIRDENRITTMMAVSTDGVTLIPLYADSSNNLLIKST